MVTACLYQVWCGDADGLDFKTIFSLEYNRTNRKFGYSREYRDVDMATYHMLGLTEEETMEIFKKRWEKTIKKEWKYQSTLPPVLGRVLSI